MEGARHAANKVHDALVALEHALAAFSALGCEHNRLACADALEIDEEHAAQLIAMRVEERLDTGIIELQATVATNQMSWPRSSSSPIEVTPGIAQTSCEAPFELVAPPFQSSPSKLSQDPISRPERFASKSSSTPSQSLMLDSSCFLRWKELSEAALPAFVTGCRRRLRSVGSNGLKHAVIALVGIGSSHTRRCNQNHHPDRSQRHSPSDEITLNALWAGAGAASWLAGAGPAQQAGSQTDQPES